jgi:hypothetical protein
MTDAPMDDDTIRRSSFIPFTSGLTFDLGKLKKVAPF